jgi:hypothetical protein
MTEMEHGTIYTDLEDIPFAVDMELGTEFDRERILLEKQIMRVSPSEDHPWTVHKVEDVEALEEPGFFRLRLSSPIS